jgi:hypothetical protein
VGRIDSFGRLLLALRSSSGMRMEFVAAMDDSQESKSRSGAHVLLPRHCTSAGGDAMNDEESGWHMTVGD